MSSTPKKTPSKKEKDEQPRQATPIRSHLVTRAVSLQAKKAGLTPERKQDTLPRRRATPRRPKSEDKHDSESAPTSESEADTDGEKVVKEGEPNGTAGNSDNKTHPNKDPEHKLDKAVYVEITPFKTDNSATQTKHEKKEIEETEKPIDETEKEIKEREQELQSLYNQLWEAENKKREQITERERQRRIKVARKIDQEHERRISELYEQPSRGENKSYAKTSSSPMVPETHTTYKLESDSDDEDSSRIGKLEEELERVRTSLDEKEELIGKLQKARGSGDVMHHPVVAHTVAQLEEKRKREEKTFTDGRKDLEERLHSLQHENKDLKSNLEELVRQAEQLVAERKAMEEKLGEQRRALELKESNFNSEVEKSVRNTLRALKAQRKSEVEQSENRAQEEDPIPLPDVVQNEENNGDSYEETIYDDNTNYENEAELSENGYPETDRPEAEFENTSEFENVSEFDNPEEESASRKRKRLEDDEVDGDLGEANGNSVNREVEGVDNAAKNLYRKILKPYAKRGLACVATATFIGAVHYANEYARYVPGL